MYDVSLPNMFAVPFVMIGVLTFIAGLFALWIWGLVDCLRSELDQNEKLLWVLIIIFLHALGALIYFVLRPDRNVSSKKSAKNKSARKVLHRSAQSKVLGGVCAGLAETYDVDVTAVRLLTVVLALVTSIGPAVLAYLVLWIIMPER